MTDTPRPRLNTVTIWRANQVALQEGIGLSDAIERMIAADWDRRMAARTRACYPPAAAEKILAAGRQPIGAAS
jgi:hypothetical protein